MGGCVNLMCPGTKVIEEAGGGVAEKMLVLAVVITAVGEQRAHDGPVCLVAGGGGWRGCLIFGVIAHLPASNKRTNGSICMTGFATRRNRVSAPIKDPAGAPS